MAHDILSLDAIPQGSYAQPWVKRRSWWLPGLTSLMGLAGGATLAGPSITISYNLILFNVVPICSPVKTFHDISAQKYTNFWHTNRACAVLFQMLKSGGCAWLPQASSDVVRSLQVIAKPEG
jgi:hypothetical protein